MKAIRVPVSAGEVIDKITILEVKSERMSDAIKLANVTKELDLLNKTWEENRPATPDIETQKGELKKINERLWEIEDEIRLLEGKRDFGDKFVELARAVYVTNDVRAEIKKSINDALGSELTEEKSYADYQGEVPTGN
jgi:uncharacterized protein DUF6165